MTFRAGTQGTVRARQLQRTIAVAINTSGNDSFHFMNTSVLSAGIYTVCVPDGVEARRGIRVPDTKVTGS